MDIAEKIALFKSGMDGLRTVIGVVRDIRSALPDGPKKEAIVQAVEMSEHQLQLAEAQIAQGLGYDLCRCEFPPTPMLTVGRTEQHRGRETHPVHRCPKCGITDNGSFEWRTTEQIKLGNP